MTGLDNDGNLPAGEATERVRYFREVSKRDAKGPYRHRFDVTDEVAALRAERDELKELVERYMQDRLDAARMRPVVEEACFAVDDRLGDWRNHADEKLAKAVDAYREGGRGV